MRKRRVRRVGPCLYCRSCATFDDIDFSFSLPPRSFLSSPCPAYSPSGRLSFCYGCVYPPPSANATPSRETTVYAAPWPCHRRIAPCFGQPDEPNLSCVPALISHCRFGGGISQMNACFWQGALTPLKSNTVSLALRRCTILRSRGPHLAAVVLDRAYLEIPSDWIPVRPSKRAQDLVAAGPLCSACCQSFLRFKMNAQHHGPTD
ncbi:hypothetical protein B0J12DRAFT_180256 [Macrophomina phaseolina]|uniref:C2H2-type domain-containing protein n=1 Tax=Macrophomina phaseolina TaxID=35725 RepID=A0ABQ8G4B2_9PEZI|nr:hypothetical protein B0J12DRAFT_180256 [Macrophomina phaseolina]